MGEEKASRRSTSYILTAEDELYGWVQRPSLNSRNLFLFVSGASPQADTCGVEKPLVGTSTYPQEAQQSGPR